MRTIFAQEMEQLQTDLVRMAQQCKTAITKAVKAMQRADLVLAEQVIDADKRIDALEAELAERSQTLLARQAPVARDLRLIVSCLRLSGTLERMGDLASHVAVVARGRYPDQVVGGAANKTLLEMGERAVHAADLMVNLLENLDLDVARQIENDDDALDQLHQETFTLILDDSVDLNRQEVVDVVLVGRYLERFGDHAVSAARRITYLVTGTAMLDEEQEQIEAE